MELLQNGEFGATWNISRGVAFGPVAQGEESGSSPALDQGLVKPNDPEIGSGPDLFGPASPYCKRDSGGPIFQSFGVLQTHLSFRGGKDKGRLVML